MGGSERRTDGAVGVGGAIGPLVTNMAGDWLQLRYRIA